MEPCIGRAHDRSMGTTPNLTTTVNDIIREHPHCEPLLFDFGIDTCCGGSSTLEQAASDAGVDPQLVVQAINNCETA